MPRNHVSRWLVLAPITLMASIQVVSGVPHPSYFADRGIRRGLTVVASRLLFSPGEIGANLLHVPAFALLALLWCWALSAWCSTRRAILSVAALLSLSFAVLNEWSQVLVPRRFASLGDVAANSVGVGVGLALALAAGRLQNRPSSSTGD